MFRTACLFALILSSLARISSAQDVCIDFESLADGEVVTNQFPGVTFWSDPGYMNLAVSGTLGSSPPNYLCTGSIETGMPTCQQRTFVRFVPAVSNLSFKTVADDKAGVIAKCDVYVGDVFEATVDVIGDGNPFTSETVDLSAYTNVSRIRLRGITDSSGLGWDDFCFDNTCADNDDCFCATAISGEGIFGFANQTANTDGDPHPLCGTDGVGNQIRRDVWFAWTPDETCDYVIETCGQTNVNTRIGIYSGDCSDLALLDCSDNACSTQSRIFGAGLVAGTMYRIRIGSSPGAAGGTGTFSITKMDCDIVTNNECEAAEPIVGTGVFTYDNTFGTTDGHPDPLCDGGGSSQIEQDVWYRWTAPCDGDFSVSTCFLSVANTKVAIYDGVNCNNSDVIACNDDYELDGCGVQSKATATGLIGGQEYLIRIGNSPVDPGGTASLFLIQGPEEEATNYCVGGVNLDGETASMTFNGDLELTLNNFELVSNGVSSQAQFGLFVMGNAQTRVPFGEGFLCVQPNNSFHRLIPVISFSNVDQVTRPLDFGVFPTDSITPYSTWNFQFWYRDLGETNLSDALSVCFGP